MQNIDFCLRRGAGVKGKGEFFAHRERVNYLGVREPYRRKAKEIFSDDIKNTGHFGVGHH